MKKVKYIILVGLLAFAGMLLAKAEDLDNNLTPENIANAINTLNLQLDYCDAGDDNKVTATYNTSDNNNTIEIKCKKSSEEKTLINFKYDDTGKTLEYTRQEPEEDGITKDEASLFKILDNVLDTVLKASGNANVALPETFDDETNNFKLEVVPVASDPLFQDAKDAFIREGLVLPKQENIKTLKISLDKDKINAFVTASGDKWIRKLIEIKPTLTAGTVTHESVSLNPTFELEPEEQIDEEYKASCYILRSTSNDEDSYQIVANPDNCLSGTTINDATVDPATTYYYKIQLEGSSKISDPVTVTTAAAPVIPDPEPTPDDNTNVTPDNTVVPDNNKENPNTGAFIPVAALSILTIGGAATLVYTMKKNKFKKL